MFANAAERHTDGVFAENGNFHFHKSTSRSRRNRNQTDSLNDNRQKSSCSRGPSAGALFCYNQMVKTLGCLEKLYFLFKYKAGEYFNRRNTYSILRIKMRA